jgi:protein-tyrosine-phosphatase
VTAHDRAKGGGGRAPRYRSLLLICAANTARSVMAEHVMRRELRARGIDGHVRVASAGIAAYARDGALISLDTRLVLRSEGIEIGEDATSVDLKRHPELLEQAELVLAMTRTQAEELRAKFEPPAHAVVSTFKEFAGDDGDIEDPFEQGDAVFHACLDEIKRLAPRIVDRILAG